MAARPLVLKAAFFMSYYLVSMKKNLSLIMFSDKKQLPQVLETYRQQGAAMVQQHDFADFMYDVYFEKVRNWDYDESVPQFIAYCRGLVKFYDLRQSLDRDMELLRVEQDLLSSRDVRS